jgi:hypothetical protein
MSEKTSINPILGRIASLRGARNPHGLLGSDTNFAAVHAPHPLGEPKARRIWALTPKTLLRSVRLTLHPDNRISRSLLGYS